MFVTGSPFKTIFQCLLPLANRPMLAYTLDFLKGSGVQEVIVYCTDFAPEIRKYLAKEADFW
jgi:NDP-sugar pyrophosphorylase family protein